MQIPSSLAINGYDRARDAAQPGAPQPRAEAAFGQAMGSFVSGLQASEQAATASMVSGADPHALVQALADTELAVQTAVSVRDRVVEAYLEILRMPV
ncbi:Flagellar hook-basal body complex protein FliE [Roseibaca ekhonensis]|jgi:flagellar hook-basal body complex protein FliE|uniref:Flagellar hook-basal body complex protein FliE n=1 Tax=Roseinatronobacter ekhonensis TaxID=254356 RepID=A0A3B0MPD4_9RHOB|nr:flagellar hook-basal body complex protein FliE [Roseibaca ekhonensis]SUZ30764.1 Flagellar hook-basal body complex protein FliE [Roseibaca ekhonensis]